MAPTSPKKQAAGHLPGYLPPADLPTAPLCRTPTVACAGIVLERHESTTSTARQYVTTALAGSLGGPACYRPGECGRDAGYTTFLPASAARVWQVHGTVVLQPTAVRLVAAPDHLDLESMTGASWQVAPSESPGTLRPPALLAWLLARSAIAAGGECGRA
jgi:hypothetical protein